MTPTTAPRVAPPTPARRPGDARRAGADWRRQVPRMFAALLWFIAAICALAAVSSAANAEFQPIRTTIDTLLVPAPANLAYAVFLGTLAAAVLRRKRLAYWVLVVYFILSLIVGVLTGLLLVTVGADRLTDDTGRRLFTLIETVGVWVGIGFAAAALALLLAARREFYARVRSGSTRRALGVFFGLAAAAVGLGYLLLTAVPGSLRSWLDRVGYAVEKVFGGAITFDVTRHGQAPGWVNLLLGVFGAVASPAGLFTLLRSQRLDAVLHPRRGAADARAAGPLRRPGLARLLRHPARQGGRSSRRAARPRSPTGWSTGSAWPAATRSATRRRGARRIERLAGARPAAYGWTPAVMGASEEGAHRLRAGRAAGRSSSATRRSCGPAEFDLDGPGDAPGPAGGAPGRAGRATPRGSAGTPRSRRTSWPTSPRWPTPGATPSTERGFSMALGRLGDPADGDCVLVEARDGDGRAARRCCRFVPWGADGLSLDLMRRDRARRQRAHRVHGRRADAARRRGWASTGSR